MKLDERRLVDQALASEELCLGAVFCTYTFEPAYFEEQVLRAVLRLGSDPQEDSARYHEEALLALKETPVACIVDASVRSSGHRLPYDLHRVHSRTFHPKVFLLVFENEARLAVGSGNVTKSGFEQNTELFFMRSLRYDEPRDVLLLREADEFIGHCQTLSKTPGTQLDLVRRALMNRLRLAPNFNADMPREMRFVSSFGGALLDVFNRALHEDAKLIRVGVLAPFFEQDDVAVADAEHGMQALLSDLLNLRLPATKDIELDIGAPWDDAPLSASTAAEPPSLDEGKGALWAWRRCEERDDNTVERMSYFTMGDAKAKLIKAIDAAGKACHFEREQLTEEIAAGRLWRIDPPKVHAPKTILERIAENRTVNLWLHPSTELAPEVGVRRRPLHAKVVLVTSIHRGRVSTLALIGSANASRAALCRGVDHRGNVEACVLCRFDREVTIQDVLPSLVKYRLDGVDLIERLSPAPDYVDLSYWVQDVVHDATARTLSVTWNNHGPAPLGAWKLRYCARALAQGTDAPKERTLVEGFDLDAASAELTLVAGGTEWHLPIRVLDLVALPTSPMVAQLGLRELLALLGRRVGSERLATLRAQRGPTGVASVLDAVFGESFGPTDVFKAWWGAVEDLSLATSYAAFRYRLESPMGALTTWSHLRKVPESELSRDEVWVYGCELLKELTALELASGPDTPDKKELLGNACKKLAAELNQMAPSGNGQTWLATVSQFYGVGGIHDRV